MLSLPDTASALSVSERTLRRWIADGAPHIRKENGRYELDPDAVQAWRDETQGRNIKDALIEAKVRKTTVEAERAELSLQTQAGGLVSLDEVKRLEYQRILKVREGLLALEHTLPPRLVGLDKDDMRVLIRRETRRLLEEYARGRTTDELAGDADPSVG